MPSEKTKGTKKQEEGITLPSVVFNKDDKSPIRLKDEHIEFEGTLRKPMMERCCELARGVHLSGCEELLSYSFHRCEAQEDKKVPLFMCKRKNENESTRVHRHHLANINKMGWIRDLTSVLDGALLKTIVFDYGILKKKV